MQPEMRFAVHICPSRRFAVKKKAWDLFARTGNPCYYLLYKELCKDDGHINKSDSSENDGFQGKR